MGQILINCDLGENETDEQTRSLLRLVDAANICCGVHAGSETKTRKTLEWAAAHKLLIGAHPGLSAGGGRGASMPDPQAFRSLLDDQVTHFISIAREVGAPVAYVKLHGSLYHAVEREEEYARTYLEWLKDRRDGLGVFSLAGGSFAPKAKAAGIRLWLEGFADRGYRADGSLVPRTEMGAVLDTGSALKRFENWMRHGRMDTVDAVPIVLNADTFCVHSDSPDSETLLAGLRNLLTV